MIALECVAAVGSRSTISERAAISPSPKSHWSARHRVRRPIDYPAALGLDPKPSSMWSKRKLVRASPSSCGASLGMPPLKVALNVLNVAAGHDVDAPPAAPLETLEDVVLNLEVPGVVVLARSAGRPGRRRRHRPRPSIRACRRTAGWGRGRSGSIRRGSSRPA